MASNREPDLQSLATVSTQDGQSIPPPPKTTAERSKTSVEDLWKLALKIERLTRIAQQSVLLLMCFGIAVSAMLYGDIVHMEVLALFTVCSYILLRWGLPR